MAMRIVQQNLLHAEGSFAKLAFSQIHVAQLMPCLLVRHKPEGILNSYEIIVHGKISSCLATGCRKLIWFRSSKNTMNLAFLLLQILVELLDGLQATTTGLKDGNLALPGRGICLVLSNDCIQDLVGLIVLLQGLVAHRFELHHAQAARELEGQLLGTLGGDVKASRIQCRDDHLLQDEMPLVAGLVHLVLQHSNPQLDHLLAVATRLLAPCSELIAYIWKDDHTIMIPHFSFMAPFFGSTETGRLGATH